MIWKLRFVIVSMVFLCALQAWGKTSEAEHKALLIKTDPEYIYGEGWGDTPGDADKAALMNLLSKIGTTVESSFTLDEQEVTQNGEIDSRSNVKSVMNTYSQATLNNTETCYFTDGERGYYLIRYMKRSELDNIFARRLDRVEDYVRTAVRSEEKGRVDDALRFYNWAYVLLHSLQYPSQVKMKIAGEEQLLVNWIPMQMSEILKQVKVGVAEVKKDNTVDVMFTYKDTPAEGLDFTYWNGKINSPLHSVKDGMGQLSFPTDFKPEEIVLSIETRYDEAAVTDKELEMMMRGFKSPSFAEARKVVGVAGKELKEDKESRKNLAAQVSMGKKEGVTPLPKGECKDYDRIVKDVIASVTAKRYNPDKSNFTEEGLAMFERLMGYGKASLVGNPDPGYYPFGDKVVCRSIPMQFRFINNKRTFIEDVTFTFNSDKKIESVAFGLGGAARRDIFSQGGDVWGDSIKMVIVTFLENYKTAFALKRLDYIKSIFDDNAYIIVGHKLQKLQKTGGDAGGFSIGSQYEFQQKTKGEYMAQLEKCFASNEFVNINFADNDVQKAAFGGNTFGIQIKQDYHSEHYGDQGYLFLFVDLNEADKPVIKIRTWQPERNADITPMIPKTSRDYGIYGVYSFQ